MNIDTRIRDAILEAMHRKGMTQADLARKLGIKPQSVYPVLRGARGKQPKSLLEILEALDLELVVKPKEKPAARGPEAEVPAWHALVGLLDDPDFITTNPGEIERDLGASLEREHLESLEGKR